MNKRLFTVTALVLAYFSMLIHAESASAVKTVRGDLALFGLKGNVKKITDMNWVSVDGIVNLAGTADYDFTPEGYLSGYYRPAQAGMKSPVTAKDDQGRLLSITSENETMEGEKRLESTTFFRDASGRIVRCLTTDASDPDYVIWDRQIAFLPDGRISSIKHSTEYDEWTEYYKYDANGRQNKSVNKNAIGTYTTTYIYRKYDDKGNWEKRRDSDGNEIVRSVYYFKPESVTAPSAAPVEIFKGEWGQKKNPDPMSFSSTITMDLYKKGMYDYEGEKRPGYGIIDSNRGMQMCVFLITDCKTEGDNKAQVTLLCDRNGITYKTIMTYNPSTAKLTLGGNSSMVPIDLNGEDPDSFVVNDYILAEYYEKIK